MAAYTTAYSFDVTLIDLDKRVGGSKDEYIYQWGGTENYGEALDSSLEYHFDPVLENKPRMTRKKVLVMVGEKNITRGKVFVANVRMYHGNCFSMPRSITWYEIKDGKIVESGRFNTSR